MSKSKGDSEEKSVFDAVSSISTRFPFAHGKRLLSSLKIPTNLGWDRTINGLRNFNESQARDGAKDELVETFSKHTFVGDKLVRFYGYENIPEIENFRLHVSDAKNNIEIPSSEYTEAFPLSINDKDLLRALDDAPPKLTSISEQDNSIVFQYSSVRSYSKKVELDKNSFEEVDQGFLEDYSEIYGMKPMRNQAFDSVIVHLDQDVIELRIDAPDGIPTIRRHRAVVDVTRAFDELALANFGYAPFGTAAKNFYNIISRLYNASSEGSVFMLGFTANSTKTSSNNDAKLIRKKGRDLRHDDFHKGGKNAVQSIDPYTIGVEWKVDKFEGTPKLIVPGSVRMLYHSPIIFPDVLIRDCFSEEEFGFVIKKIEKYLKITK
ncbi:MAG: hypothetical protein HY254_10260 [Burkholderiales bacterium]|nr:hypothetical protein [Burkholderiales bacterium]